MRQYDYEECAWCGAEADHRYPNRRGEVFCSANHRRASNRALSILEAAIDADPDVAANHCPECEDQNERGDCPSGSLAMKMS